MLKKIIKNLEAGNYRIEYREKCECKFDWRLENGELVGEAISTDGGCWFDNALIMDDLAGQCDDDVNVGSDGVIVTYDAYFGFTVQTICLNHVVQEIFKFIIDDGETHTKLTAGIKSPDANNDLHDRRERESLAKWLSDNKHLKTYVYYPRDFANEYVCGLLVLPSYYRKKDLLWVPVHWYSKSAEEWAEMFLQKDTDGTQYDIGFELINELYEIDYCWYDRHADATVSHDTERYFFVDLQAAEADLKARSPEGVNCYDLNKLTIDYSDGEIMEIDYIATNWGPEAAKEARENGNRFAPDPEPEKEPEPEITPEMVFERYSKEYGLYNWQGIELTLIQDPYLSEDVFGDPCYYADAIDRQGNGWGIKWEILPEIDINDTDAGDHCDWENPTYAKMDEEEFYLYLI